MLEKKEGKKKTKFRLDVAARNSSSKANNYFYSLVESLMRTK